MMMMRFVWVEVFDYCPKCGNTLCHNRRIYVNWAAVDFNMVRVWNFISTIGVSIVWFLFRCPIMMYISKRVPAASTAPLHVYYHICTKCFMYMSRALSSHTAWLEPSSQPFVLIQMNNWIKYIQWSRFVYMRKGVFCGRHVQFVNETLFMYTWIFNGCAPTHQCNMHKTFKCQLRG